MNHYLSAKDAKESIKLFSKQQYIKHFFFFFLDGMSISDWKLCHYQVWYFLGQA